MSGLRAAGGVAKKSAKRAAGGFSGELGRRDLLFPRANDPEIMQQATLAAGSPYQTAAAPDPAAACSRRDKRLTESAALPTRRH